MKKTCVRILCAALVLCFALGMLTACGEKKEDAKTVSLSLTDISARIVAEAEQPEPDAAKILGIHVLDHLIIGGDKYYSFAEHGEI